MYNVSHILYYAYYDESFSLSYTPDDQYNFIFMEYVFYTFLIE